VGPTLRLVNSIPALILLLSVEILHNFPSIRGIYYVELSLFYFIFYLIYFELPQYYYIILI
jgi:hypothetical protein